MTSFRPVPSAHNRLPIARGSTRPGAVGRVLPILAASLALAVGADSAQAAAPDISAASDTLRVTLLPPDGGTVDEGATGHFEVSVAGSTAAGAVTVQYSVSGTALAGEDYTALSGEATVAQGESVARIALEALKDGILDKGETVVLALTGATGSGTVLVDQAAATATIADNGSVTIALAAVSDTIGEGSTWNSAVIMSTPVADRVSVRWWTKDGTALAGRDYAAADEIVSLQPGETSKPISVETLQDDNTEAVEVFYVSLGLPVDAARTGIESAFRIDPQPQSAFIECSIRFPQRGPIVFRLNDPVSAGTLVGTVSAEAPGIADYFLTGGDNKFTINARGQIRTTAALDAGSLYELAVTAVDQCDAKASVEVTVIVNSSPETKGTIPDATVEVGESGRVDASSYFSDPDGNRLTYKVGSSGPGTVGVSVVGSKVTYKGLKAGSATVTVTATDPGGLSAEQTFTVTVEPPNEPPDTVGTIPDDTIEVGESGSVHASSYFNDPEGEDLIFSATSSNEDAVGVSVAGSEVTYKGLEAGSATVTVTATDPGGLSAEQTFTVTVEPPNEPPDTVGTIPDDTIEVGESGSVHASSYFNDPEGEDLIFSATSSNEDAVGVSVAGSEVTYNGLEAGSATVTVTATDPGDLSAEQVFTVTVLPPACDITVEDGTFTVPEDATDVGTVGVTADHCGDLEYALTGAGAGEVSAAAVNGSNPDAAITGDFDFERRSSYALTLTVSEEGGSASASGSVSITVTNVNEPPVVDDEIDDLTLYVGEGTTQATINLSNVFSDPDGDVLSYEAVSSDTDIATATVSGNNLTVTATGKGETTITVTAEDPGGLEVDDEFEVRVPNRKPTPKGTIRDRDVEVGDSRSVDVKQYFRDPDGDTLTYTSTSSDANKLTVNRSGNPVRFTGVAEGSSRLTVTARDGGGLTATQRFDVEVYEPTQDCKIDVSAANLPVPENAGVGTPVSGVVGVTASDCGTLRYALSGTGSGDFSVSAASANDDAAKIRVKRALNHEGRDAYDLTLTVSWGSVSHAGDVDISVTDVNEAPKPSGTIGRQTVRVGRSGSVNVTGYFTDEDAGDRLTFTSESSATGRLTVSGSGSPVMLTGVAAGSATVTVTARDRGGLTATQTFPVTVEPAPIPCGITVSDGALSVREDAGVGAGVDGEVTVTRTGDCGTLSYALSGTGAADFSVSAAGASDDDGKIKVGRTLNHEGRDAYDLTLTVSEVGGVATGAGDVDISVTDVNEAPKPNGAIVTQKVRIGRPGSVDVTSYFTDEDAGDRLTFTSKSSATGKLTVNASGSPVTLTGVAVGSAAVTVTARDRGGLTATQTFSVTVDPAPTKPCGITVSDGSLSVPEDAGVGDGVDGKVGVTTTGDCGTLGYSLSGTGSADFTAAAAGSSDDDAKVRVAKALDHETRASYALTLTVSWGSVSDEGEVGISVTDVNDAPEVVSAIPALTLNSGDSKVVDVSSRFRDPDGDALTYEASSSKEAAATVAVSGSGVTVTGVSPGESRVTVTARDGRGGSVSQDFTVTVENQAPEVVSAIPALTVAAGSSKAVDVSAHFRDPNGDALTYAAKSATEAAATVAVSGSEVTVTGVSEGESEVTVTVRDTHGAEVSQVFTATVGPDNEAPVVVSAIPALTVAAGETAVVDVSAHFSDPDDDALTYEAESSNEGAATVALSGSEVTVTGVLHGESRVTVTARDGRGGSASQDFAVTVPNRPPEPVGSLDRAVAYRAVTTTVEVSGAFSDPDGDGLTYRAVPADGGIVSVWVSGSQVRLQGRLRKSTTVTVTADDGHGGTAQQTFEVEVANHPPVAVNRMRPRTIAPGERFTVTLSDYFRDTDGDAMTYTGVVSDSTVADVSVEGEELVVVGESRGRVVVTAKAHDGHGGTGLQWFPLTVTNGRPVFDADAYEREVAENSAAGTAVGDPVTATDDDGDDVAYGFISGGDEAPFGIDAASGQITVAEGAVLDYESGTTAYAVRVEASDGTRADTAAVTIRVTDVPAPGRPDAPVVTGGTEEVAVSWSAPENAGPEITNYDLRYRAKADSEWTDVSALGAVLARTITGLEAGTAYQVQVRAESSEGAGEWSESGEGTTEAANRAPSFGAETYEREVLENSAAGTAVGEPVTATDDDGDDLAYSLLSGGEEAPFGIVAATGQIRVAEGAVLDYESGTTAYTVSVRASDGTRADTAAVTIRVTDVPVPGKPDAPVVTGGTEEVAVSWSAPANEGPAITGYGIRHRTKSGGEWTAPTALGVVLAHTITDLNGGTTYQVQVRAESSEGAGEWSEPGEGTAKTANRAPSFDAAAYERSVPESSAPGTAVGEPVTATDDDGDDLAYSFLPGGEEAPFEIVAATGQIRVAGGAALDYESGTTVYTVSVRASDGTRADTAAVTIRVTDVPAPGKPDAPVVKGGTEEVAVSWSAPENEGPAITGYDLRYRAKADGEWTDVSALGPALAHTITDLNGATTYQVQVRAISSEGAGEWSEPGEGTAEAANRAPSFDAETYEREVPENSAGGTAVGEPVTADDDGGELSYRFVTGGEAPFEIDAATGRITVAEGAALNYESGETQFTVRVEASDGELADIASVTIRVTNADEDGVLTLSPEVARVGVELTATLTDEDGAHSAGRNRKWQRSADGTSWNDIGTGRMYNPVTADAGRWLRAVFTYADGHGPGKRAVSERVKVLAANAAPAFEADAYEREVPENSEGGTKIGRPVRATDGDGDELVYGIVGGGDEAPFEIHATTGRIRVAVGAALNYESGDTLFTVAVEASDGELADTASVTIRVTDADDPGEVALVPEVARVGVELTADLTDEDGAQGAGRKRKWQRSADGNSWNDIASGRRYTPVTTDEGRWLRAVFDYTDGHGPDKRAVSAPVKVLAANAAPSFAAVYEREVPENSPGGTNVGAPVAATDPDNTALSYSIASGGDEALFEIGAATGQITVADGAALDYESGDTLLAVRVEASDGELADTASVKIRMTNADDPGQITLSADVARVGVRLTATLMDQDRSVERSKMRTWQRSPDGATWTMVVQGAERRFYTPTAADRGQYLRAVFTYTDGHGPGKRAESAAVAVVGASTPVVSFGADSYTAALGGSADVAVLLSPAASSALAIGVVAGDNTHTATVQPGASSATVAVGTAGLSASDTLAVRFGALPDGVAIGVPATTRIIVAAAAGDRASRSVVEDGSPIELEVEYAQAEYVAVAGGPVTEVTLRVSPAADRRVAVPLTVGRAISPEPAVPDSVVFEPGDSLAAFMLDVPAGTEPGLLALGLGALPEAVSAGTVASATVDIAAGDIGALRDEAFEVGLAVFGRAVAEGARQAVGARIDAVMRPERGGSGTPIPGSASEWTGRAAGTLASLAGLPPGASSSADMAQRRSGSLELPTGREVAGRLLPRVSFATGLGPQAAQGRPRFGLWAEGSTQSFRGEHRIDYDGGLRALTVGADARIGSSGLLGLSLMRSDGDLDYGNRSVDGSLGHAMNSIHPYLFLQPSPRIGLWAMAGYGSGDVRDDDRQGDTGASLRMLAGGVRVPLARSGAFGLALTGDAFTVGMRASDRGGEGSASRARALLEASWTAGGLKLATQAGARYDAGDADTGGGAETGASVGYAGHGLDLDLRGRLALGSGRHREWGAALRLAFDPGTRGEGFRLAISPGHGHDQSGVHGLMDGRALQAMPTATRPGQQWRLDGEVGYALKNPGGGGALDSYTRLSSHGRNRSLSFGTRYGVNQLLRLGIEASRSQLPGQHPNLGLRLALDFTF